MHYVIIGAGPAGVIAADTLRKTDQTGGKITLLGGEIALPYSRMAIPYFLSDAIDETGAYLRKGESYYARNDIDFRQARVLCIRPQDSMLALEDGSTLSYDRLLIATGSQPVTPPIPGVDLPGIHHCWTLYDARQIRKLAKPGARVVLVGAGFIGCIIMEALRERGAALTVLEREERILPRMMNGTGANLLKRWCIQKGVTVRTATSITGIEKKDAEQDSSGELIVHLETGAILTADLIVFAVGVRPNMDFLSGSGIETDDGILVNEYLQTSQPNIYAAGDVAQGADWSTGKRIVRAIQPTAAEHGRVSACNMAGVPIRYPGSFDMNVLDTMGLVSVSMGQSETGHDIATLLDWERYRYTRLAFEEDVLIGALSIGGTQFSGVLRGLIQGKTRLGKWKQRLQADPSRVAEAYVACIRDMQLPQPSP
uniref:Pyridine nucleotide-disulphide oxidoreductase n=1 Tax=Candidatus Kentrum sp. MB TaxID=2138164 RepID=A0A450XJ68_9GAMM|nr:MAG: Pyridine nucleotide-disulphide oxidoreductase [Candidatus Kentron sp. MB]VFK29289.1 MAG: Pyridine nucleotide-disulphide oxidoreductase [Candidatus Kentron sp. MB]VFK74729.1 MAG: Pyridine nucleotide-disulphide oxidoreductase [Candidatus Kentron sp. MB]